MNLMKAICRTIGGALFLLLAIAACTEKDVPVSEKKAISWQVESDSTIQGRVLVNNNVLQTSCTPKADGTNETIGVWGDYSVNSGGQNITVQEFVATPLTYVPGTYNNWEYPGEAKFWTSFAVYDFRACYPQKLMTTLMTQMGATMFQGGPINTLELQEDILVAAKQVDTRTDNLSEPVRLDMQHIFAAIKFKVKAVSGFTPATGEGVTSCWLQNKKTNDKNLFSPSGYLVHSGNAVPVITWHTYESSSEVRMYEWKHEGLDFTFENTLYKDNVGMVGEAYTHNDGWVLVVPQTVKEGTLTFNYTLKNAGEQVFTVNIPAITYEHGKQYTYMLEIRGSEADITLTVKPWNQLDSSYDITI